ncbi:hypothetical protein Tco_1107331 [Tanacetum coccineum]
MAALRYRDEHNKVGYLQKPKGSDDYHQILDFLGASHIRYALTINPIIFDSLVKQFWSTATLRGQLQLADDGGIDDLPIADIYSRMDNLGYVTEGKLTFYKNKFSPQWRFLVHIILHCLSSKSGSWDQFSSPIALNFVGQPMPLLAAMLSQAGEGAGVVAPAVRRNHILKPIPEPIHPDIASFSQVQETNDAPFTSTNVDDEPLRVSTLTKKGRKVVVSDSDKEDRGEQDVDFDALHALANVVVTVDSTKSLGGASSHSAAITPSSLQRCQKGKGVGCCVELTPTQDKTFQAIRRRKTRMSQDFEMTKDQRKRQQEVLASAANYSDAAWDIILARLQANPNLSPHLSGNLLSTGSRTVRKLSPEQLQEEFDKIQRAIAFIRGLKRDGSPMTTAFSKKLKTVLERQFIGLMVNTYVLVDKKYRVLLTSKALVQKDGIPMVISWR